MRSFLTSILAAALALVSATYLRAQQPLRPAARLDNYGDPLPPGAVLRLGTTRLQMEGNFVWTPDGRRVVTGRGGTLFFWDVDSGEARQTMTMPFHGHPAALSADGKVLFCMRYGGKLAVWDLETANLTLRPEIGPPADREFAALAVSPDGRTFATANRNARTVQICETNTFAVRRSLELPKHDWDDLHLAFSSTGDKLVIGAGDTLYLLPVAGAVPPATFRVHDQMISSLALHPDGKRVVTGGMGRSLFSEPKRPPTLVMETQVRVWDLADRRLLAELPIHDPPTRNRGCSVAVSPDGHQVAAAQWNKIVLWDLATQAVIRTLDGFDITNPHSCRLAFHPLGRLIGVSNAERLRMWDAETGQPHLQWHRQHNEMISAAASDPKSGLIATGDAAGEVHLWRATTGERVRAIRPGPGWIRHLEFTADGSRLLAAGDNHMPNEERGVVRLFDVASGRRIWQRLLPSYGFVAKFSPDGKQIVVSSGSFDPSPASLFWLESRSGRIVKEDPTKGQMQSIIWSPEGKRLSLAHGGTVHHLDAATGGETAKIDISVSERDPGSGREFHGAKRVILFPIGNGAVTVSHVRNALHCWDTTTGRREWSATLPGKLDMALAVSPDRRLVASLSGDSYIGTKRLCLWNIITGEMVLNLEVGLERSQFMTFIGDGQQVLVGFADGTSLLYDVSVAWNKLD